MIAYLQTTFEQHLTKEEMFLFPAVSNILGKANQPLVLLLEEHQRMRSLTDSLVKEFASCLAEMRKSESLFVIARELYHNSREDPHFYVLDSLTKVGDESASDKKGFLPFGCPTTSLKRHSNRFFVERTFLL
jgi:hypothetical protein